MTGTTRPTGPLAGVRIIELSGIGPGVPVSRVE